MKRNNEIVPSKKEEHEYFISVSWWEEGDEYCQLLPTVRDLPPTNGGFLVFTNG